MSDEVGPRGLSRPVRPAAPATHPGLPVLPALPEWERVRALVARYDRPGPRYTSYPTAPNWDDCFDEAALRDALRHSRDPELAVYVHVPFCESLCTYCACNREIHRDHAVAGPYLDALEAEAAMLAESHQAVRRCAQLALGGGTPTYLAESQLERLAGIVDRYFPPTANAERSIEVDPRVTTRGQLERLAACGFNRISLGVQDLSPRVQRAIRRVQSLEQTVGVTQAARELGFRSVNYDLIYGLPFQTVGSFDETLSRVLEQRPDRIALYSYAHVTWVSKQQRGFERGDLPDAERKLAIFTRALERLTCAGYEYLGLDHFVLPDDSLSHAARRGDLRRNFMGYTTHAPLDVVALGPSGISELRSVYAQSARSFGDWRAQIEHGRLATLRGCRLSSDDQKRRWLIHRLMCRGEIDGDAYRAEFREPLGALLPDLATRLAPFERDGLLEASRAGWRLTPVGRLFMRPVAMSFDAYLEAPQRSTSSARLERFSQTV